MRRPTVVLQQRDLTEPGAAGLDPLEIAQLSAGARASRRADFIGGRRAAKIAAQRHFGVETLTLARAKSPQKDAPELYWRTQNGLERFGRGFISIAHQSPLAAAAAFERPVGVDLVEAQSVTPDVDDVLFSPQEIKAWSKLVRTSNVFDDATGRDALFAVKECVLKIVGEGLRLPPLSFEVWPHNARTEGESLVFETVSRPTPTADPALKRQHFDPMPPLSGRLRRHAALLEGLLWDTTSTTKT